MISMRSTFLARRPEKFTVTSFSVSTWGSSVRAVPQPGAAASRATPPAPGVRQRPGPPAPGGFELRGSGLPCCRLLFKHLVAPTKYCSSSWACWAAGGGLLHLLADHQKSRTSGASRKYPASGMILVHPFKGLAGILPSSETPQPRTAQRGRADRSWQPALNLPVKGSTRSERRSLPARLPLRQAELRSLQGLALLQLGASIREIASSPVLFLRRRGENQAPAVGSR
jgi:hypothetical protein